MLMYDLKLLYLILLKSDSFAYGCELVKFSCQNFMLWSSNLDI